MFPFSLFLHFTGRFLSDGAGGTYSCLGSLLSYILARLNDTK